MVKIFLFFLLTLYIPMCVGGDPEANISIENLRELVGGLSQKNSDWNPYDGFRIVTNYTAVELPGCFQSGQKEKYNCLWTPNAKIVGFILSGPNLSDLSPISTFSKKNNVEYIRLEKVVCSDISFLDRYPIIRLDLFACKVLNSISLALPKLQALNLSHVNMKGLNEFSESPLTAISFNTVSVEEVKRMPAWRIKVCDIFNSNIQDLEPLSSKELEVLSYTANLQCSLDLLPLRSSKIEALCIQYCDMRNFDMIPPQAVKHLVLYSTNLDNCNQIKRFSNLKYLTLNSNDKLQSIEPLRQLNLVSLDIGNTDIADISALSNMTELKELLINNTSVSDISSLSNCINIERIWLQNTKITNGSVLKRFTKLKELSINGTALTDVSPLAELLKSAPLIRFVE